MEAPRSLIPSWKGLCLLSASQQGFSDNATQAEVGVYSEYLIHSYPSHGTGSMAYSAGSWLVEQSAHGI